MPIFVHLISLFWAIMILYWVISALRAKKNIKTDGWLRDVSIRVLVIIVLVIVLSFNDSWGVFDYQLGAAAQLVGVILCALGVALAIWARWHLGRNWSGVPSIKQDHELVTSGPYRFVRHPIYSGIFLAAFGSALTIGVLWLVIFVVMLVSFLLRIPVEEKYMMQLFPDQYPEYKKRTKALIPFIW